MYEKSLQSYAQKTFFGNVFSNVVQHKKAGSKIQMFEQKKEHKK